MRVNHKNINRCRRRSACAVANILAKRYCNENRSVAALQLTTNQLSMIAFYLWCIPLNLLEESVLCTRSRILRSWSLRELDDRIYLRCKCNFLYSPDVQKVNVIKLRFYRSKLSVVMTLFFIFVCLPFTLSSIISIASIYYRSERKKKTDAIHVLVVQMFLLSYLLRVCR